MFENFKYLKSYGSKYSEEYGTYIQPTPHQFNSEFIFIDIYNMNKVLYNYFNIEYPIFQIRVLDEEQ